MAGELKLDDFLGPFQPRPLFYVSMKKNKNVFLSSVCTDPGCGEAMFALLQY